MPRIIKIGFVLDDGLDQPDGVQQYILSLGAWLSAKGHDVHYLAGETARTDLVNLHVLSRNANVRFNRNRMTIPLGAPKRKVRQLLQSYAFDLLHVQMPYSPQLAGRIIAAAPQKMVVFGTFHIFPFSSLQRQAARALAAASRTTLKRFDAAVSVSPAAGQFARKTFNIDTQTLPNVINMAAFASAKPRASQYKGMRLLYLGRLVPRKGCMELLQALVLLRPGTDWHVVICGDGPLRGKLKAFVKKHGLQERVEFCGFIAEADKPGYLASADIAIFPSLGGESFGIVLLEAMAAGAGVVIGGDNPGYRTVLGEWQQCLIDPKKSQDMARRIEELIDDPGLRERLHTAQQKSVRRFDVEVVGPQLLAMYKTAIAKKDNISII